MKRRARPVLTEGLFLDGWHPYLWIALLAGALYLRTLAFGFTNFDDPALITKNYSFLSNVSNIITAFGRKVFVSSVLPYYRPMLLVSLILDAQIGGLNPVIYHLHNVLLHMAASCLVFAFLVRFGAGRRVSLFFALAFAVHPALAQAVSWIPGRNDVLAAVFTLASFLCLFAYEKRERLAAAAGHLAFFALALFTKESAVMIPVLSALYLVFVARKSWPVPRIVGIGVAYVLICGVWAVLRSRAIAGSFDMTLYDAGRFVVLYLPAVVQLIGKAVIPVELSTFPTMQHTPMVYGVIACLGIVACLLATQGRDARRITFGLAWFLLFLIPSLTRPHAAFANDVLEHRLYLPIIGLCIVCSQIRIPRVTASVAIRAGMAVIVCFAALAFLHSGDYRDSFSYWQSAVRTSPDSPFARVLLGIAYYDDDQVERAESELKRACAINYAQLRAHYYLGLVYVKKLMFRKASDEFRKEIVLYPEFDAAYSSLGAAQYRLGVRAGLDQYWKKAIALNPDNLEAYRNLALYAMEMGDDATARACVRELERRGVTVPQDFARALKSE